MDSFRRYIYLYCCWFGPLLSNGECAQVDFQLASSSSRKETKCTFVFIRFVSLFLLMHLDLLSMYLLMSVLWFCWMFEFLNYIVCLLAIKVDSFKIIFTRLADNCSDAILIENHFAVQERRAFRLRQQFVNKICVKDKKKYKITWLVCYFFFLFANIYSYERVFFLSVRSAFYINLHIVCTRLTQIQLKVCMCVYLAD